MFTHSQGTNSTYTRSNQRVTGAVTPPVKMHIHEADPSSPCSVQGKNCRAILSPTYLHGLMLNCPLQCPHESSSAARTLGSWVQIPVEAWMSVCFYFMLVCSVCRQWPCDWQIPRPRGPTDCVQIKKLKKLPGPQWVYSHRHIVLNYI
jgi:hypothetical protein